MYIDRRSLLIISICVIIGTILLITGIVLSEIEITRNQKTEIYDYINN